MRCAVDKSYGVLLEHEQPCFSRTSFCFSSTRRSLSSNKCHLFTIHLSCFRRQLLVRTITIDGSTILSFAIDLSQMNFLNGLRPPISISLTYIIVISKMSLYGGHGESIHDTLTDGGQMEAFISDAVVACQWGSDAALTSVCMMQMWMLCCGVQICRDSQFLKEVNVEQFLK